MCADRFPELLSLSVPYACSQYRRSRSLLSLMVPCLRQFLPLEYTKALLQSVGVPVAFGPVQHRPLPEKMPSCMPTAPPGPPLAPNDSGRPLRAGLVWGLNRWPPPAARSCACVTHWARSSGKKGLRTPSRMQVTCARRTSSSRCPGARDSSPWGVNRDDDSI